MFKPLQGNYLATHHTEDDFDVVQRIGYVEKAQEEQYQTSDTTSYLNIGQVLIVIAKVRKTTRVTKNEVA